MDHTRVADGVLNKNVCLIIKRCARLSGSVHIARHERWHFRTHRLQMAIKWRLGYSANRPFQMQRRIFVRQKWHAPHNTSDTIINRIGNWNWYTRLRIEACPQSVVNGDQVMTPEIIATLIGKSNFKPVRHNIFGMGFSIGQLFLQQLKSLNKEELKYEFSIEPSY